MKVKILYDVLGLLELLTDRGFDFTKIPTKDEWEDDMKQGHSYYFSKPEVVSIDYWHSLCTTAIIHLEDGQSIQALGSNITSNNPHSVALNQNDFISPILRYNGKYIEATEIVDKWLISQGISQEQLSYCSHEEAFYETITYTGVPTPSLRFGSWTYSSEDLVLSENEIQETLQSIDNVLLRKKIECILYARVFKRTRY